MASSHMPFSCSEAFSTQDYLWEILNFQQNTLETMFLGHLLVMLVHAPATDRLLWLSFEVSAPFPKTDNHNLTPLLPHKPSSCPGGPAAPSVPLPGRTIPPEMEGDKPCAAASSCRSTGPRTESAAYLRLQTRLPSRRSPERATPPGKGAGVQSSTGSTPCPNAAMEAHQGRRRGCHHSLFAHAQCRARRGVWGLWRGGC